MPTTRVIDLSHHNVVPESLQPARDSGVWAVIHKITENTSFVDDKVDSRFYLARQAGLLWGIYHFIRPDNIERQAEFFVTQADEMGVADENTLYVLDHEDPGVSIDDALLFLRTVEELTGRRPAIYSGHVLKEQLGDTPNAEISQYRLWLAQYTSGEPDMPAGFDTYWIWQFSEDGTVPGIEPPVDVNAYDGTQASLRAEWSGGDVVPEPEPEEQVVTITISAPPGVRVVVNQETTDEWASRRSG